MLTREFVFQADFLPMATMSIICICSSILHLNDSIHPLFRLISIYLPLIPPHHRCVIRWSILSIRTREILHASCGSYTIFSPTLSSHSGKLFFYQVQVWSDSCFSSFYFESELCCKDEYLCIWLVDHCAHSCFFSHCW